MTIKMRLVIEVEYDPGVTSQDQLAAILMQSADRMASEGLLTGYSDAEVESWGARVEVDPVEVSSGQV